MQPANVSFYNSMQLLTVGFYNAFKPELRKRVEAYANSLRNGDYTIKRLVIEPTGYPGSDWIAELTIDVEVLLPPAFPGELRVYDDFTVSYNLHNRRAIQCRTGPSMSVVWGWRIPVCDWLGSLQPLIKSRATERAEAIKEELAATVWAPDRVEKLLAHGGWELIESS